MGRGWGPRERSTGRWSWDPWGGAGVQGRGTQVGGAGTHGEGLGSKGEEHR